MIHKKYEVEIIEEGQASKEDKQDIIISIYNLLKDKNDVK